MDPTIALVLSRRMTELDKLETYYSFDDVLDMKEIIEVDEYNQLLAIENQRGKLKV